ncbi:MULTISPECIES: NAD(P)-dependent alcohol dehydrogenase [unclassified Micromonospora]|uniref:NAD(P)-dependent alcohol dehydrogenase n=1 Tax=unclassified Micromonospora TaxID=2617518 RepID=UPI0010340C4D|nr:MULTISPECIES: NAD(P)-dependent alcohol dehydrogenase [unclassified Micromonospora]QKW13550.1 NAD(P)-dependent alcohol dehydrogenase [Verrucosispora sp. NA02020]TBL44502.1 NAD(P)-dependent alcohol dehydrogenase [Verrucosispora sp. SN26_14.1]
MTAITQDRYGTPDTLTLREVARPEPRKGHVLIRVRAAGIHRGDRILLAGRPYAVRIVGPRAPRHRIAGTEGAGEVLSVGSAVTEFAPGDEVLGWGTGLYAEFASIPAKNLVPKPAALTFAQAAAMPVSGMTALQALDGRTRPRPGQRVLVIGAAGGVGTFAVQIARAYGAEVTGVGSSTKVDLIRSLGAEHVVDYTREDVTRSPHRFDVIIDLIGDRPVNRLRQLLAPTGTLVLVGVEKGGRLLGGFERNLITMLTAPFMRQRPVRPLSSIGRKSDLLALTQLVDAGRLTPVVDRTFPLGRTAEAFRYLADEHARGKVVITL